MLHDQLRCSSPNCFQKAILHQSDYKDYDPSELQELSIVAAQQSIDIMVPRTAIGSRKPVSMFG